MRVLILDDYAAMSAKAAEIVANLVAEKPEAVLCLPTGSTPLGFYQELVASGVSFANVTTFNLDEYRGLDRNHPQSYYQFMWQNFFRHVEIDPSRINIPDGMAADPEAECARYEAKIKGAGGIDVALLGLGHNGHIGFNEPGTPWDSRTRRVQLARRTIEANSRFFRSADEVPTEALTMGIGTILESRQILLLVSGEGKAEIVKQVLEGPLTTDVPGSVLRTHPNVLVLLDRAAASLISQPWWMSNTYLSDNDPFRRETVADQRI
jgi:glucosamine-6-phosphate deaminase